MRKVKNKAVLLAKHIHSKLRNKTYKTRSVHVGVPYFSQWESRDLVEKIISKQVEAKDDPLWRKSGAENSQEYVSWSWNCCGMACLKMILAHKSDRIVPLVALGKRCLRYGGYKLPLEKNPGLFYKPFVEFIKKEYKLDGKAVSALTLTEIKQTISDGGYAIVSVTPEIRIPNKDPMNRGGHLVLVFGYDDEKKIVYLNNPSGFNTSQENVEISYVQFKKFFDNKGIIVKK